MNETITWIPVNERLPERLAHAIQTGIPADKRLWSAEACAQYLSYSTAHFLARIACRPDFPKSRHIGTGDKGRRWKAQEVIEWAEGQ